MKDTILIVDDREYNRIPLREMLKQNYHILEASRGGEALDLLAAHAESIALVLLDVLMPDMDGYAVMEAMQERGYLADIPVIVITVVDDVEAEVRMLALGAHEFLCKPFEISVAKKRIENTLQAYEQKRLIALYDSYHTISPDSTEAAENEKRYEALLYCLDSTVLDVDIAHDCYNLLYPVDPELDIAGARGSFSHLRDYFHSEKIYPSFREDFSLWLRNVSTYVHNREGICSTFKCRIFNAAAKDFLWYKITATNMGTPPLRPNRFLLVFRDIENEQTMRTERRKLVSELESDPLTGVLNRKAMEEKTRAALASRPEMTHALVVIDIDNFKQVNDTAGHQAGDKAILHTTTLLKSVVRQEDLVGRIGGDEFMLLLQDIKNTDNLRRKLDELRRNFSQPSKDPDCPAVTISMGAALHQNGKDFAELFGYADKALYIAKRGGKARWHIYEQE